MQQQHKSVLEFLEGLGDRRRDSVLQFHQDYRSAIAMARGSQSKHQAWPGGYLDHLGEIFRIAASLYHSLSQHRSLPFALDAAIVVLYFHDVEKIWKYSTGLPDRFDKKTYLFETLHEQYNIQFSPAETNALTYIHGEPEAEYNPETRIMGPLAAFCHAADTLSARLWFDEGRGLG